MMPLDPERIDEAGAASALTDSCIGPSESSKEPPPGFPLKAGIGLAVILIVAAGLRFWRLGELSFWYDEIVTMRLAQALDVNALVARLDEIDATRAPLHPLILHAWITSFGSSEASARVPSAVCGVLTVGTIYWLGRAVFDARTAVFASWLAALSPLLVYYSREARMYALLVLLAALCWAVLLSARSRGTGGQIAYVAGVTALLYSHPLGLLMAGTLAGASALFARRLFGGYWRWLAANIAPWLLAGPWLWRYFDHAPEFLSGRLPIRFLLGTPIGYLGGNSALLMVLAGVAVFGLACRARNWSRWDDWTGAICLTLWLVVPPTALYLYSWCFNPVFGPSRYTLFVAPAYLLLVAQGLARLPRALAWSALVGVALLAARALGPSVHAADLKADWRSLAALVTHGMQRDPNFRMTVIVHSNAPGRNVEVETARYYLPANCHVVSGNASMAELLATVGPDDLVLETFPEQGWSEAAFPVRPETAGWRIRELEPRFAGLMVFALEPPARQPEARSPAGPGSPGPR